MKFGLELRNQSSGEPPLLSRVPTQLSAPPVQAQGGWLIEDDINRGPLRNRPLGLVQESDVLKPEKQRTHQNLSLHTTSGSTPTGLLSQTSEVKSEEVCIEFSYLLFSTTASPNNL